MYHLYIRQGVWGRVAWGGGLHLNTNRVFLVAAQLCALQLIDPCVTVLINDIVRGELAGPLLQSRGACTSLDRL